MTAPTETPALPASARVPGTYVRLLADHMQALGLDFASVLGEEPPAPELSYPALHWGDLLARAATRLEDPTLGLHIGARITPAHLGPLGYVLLASPSVPAALERYMRYQRLVHDVSPVRYYQEGELLVLEWSPESRAVGLLANQCGMAAVVQFARHITDTRAAPTAVHFVEAAPADLRPYTDFFDCPVRFGESATRLLFPLAFLNLPLRRSDPALLAMLEQQVQALWSALPERDDLEQRLRQLLAQALLQGEPALEPLAAVLNLSGRTLRRRLEERGWSFRELLNDTRRRLAEDYLRDRRLGLPEVALLLGYSEQSAFNRAFRGWMGMTPRQWRLGATTKP